MRLTLRQQPSQSESSWRKLFSRSKKQHKSEAKSTADALAVPEFNVACPAVAAPQTYHPVATPRSSSEYASSIGGPPEDDGSDMSPTSPTSASSPWSGSLLDSPTSSKRFSYSAPPRPMSLFSFGRGSSGDDADDVFAHPAAQPIQEDGQLILTMTSKYPTGLAAERYVPIDVSMPQRTSTLRRFTRIRPSSVMLTRPSSSWSKRTSMME